MAKITQFKGYDGPRPDHPGYHVPKPEVCPDPIVLNAQDGVPVQYPNCAGLGVRVVHPSNPKAPSRNIGLVLFYVPPHATLDVGHHPTEETYVVLEGEATMIFERSRRVVKKGDFIHLPPWTRHGVENTGRETFVVLICTTPPNP